jgi:hypothetical protein
LVCNIHKPQSASVAPHKFLDFIIGYGVGWLEGEEKENLLFEPNTT